MAQVAFIVLMRFEVPHLTLFKAKSAEAVQVSTAREAS